MFFMVPAEQDRSEGFRAALQQISRLANQAGSNEAAIAVHTKHNVSCSAIETILGPRDTKQFLRGSVVLADIRLHLITEKIQSQLLRGPLLAAYISPWFLEDLVNNERFTDVLYLPWTRKDEASFFHQFSPQILMPTAGWNPPPSEVSSKEAAHEESSSIPSGIRESLKLEERVLPLEHTIDPGFVNHRRIETIIGQEGRNAIDRAIAQLPPMPEGLRAVKIGHLYSNMMLSFCRVHEVPPLGRLLAELRGAPIGAGRTARLFCSTERVGACPSLGNEARAVNKWRPLSRGSTSVEFHYSVGNIFSDTTRGELRKGSEQSMIAELHSIETDKFVFYPLVMGGPWLTSRDPQWQTAVMWWSREFYEDVIEDFDEFAAVRNFPKPPSFESMREISENVFKHCLAEIIGGDVTKDWGGETSDFYTAHLRLAGRRVSGAFLLKGPARFTPMRLNNLGKNNDQIVRLSSEPADILFVQHCHEITAAVRATLRAFAVQPSRPRRYCLIDGRDSLWLLQAYGLYDKAVQLSKKKRVKAGV